MTCMKLPSTKVRGKEGWSSVWVPARGLRVGLLYLPCPVKYSPLDDNELRVVQRWGLNGDGYR